MECGKIINNMDKDNSIMRRLVKPHPKTTEKERNGHGEE